MKKYIKKSTKFIVIGYFIISCLYIVISDWFLQYFFQADNSNLLKQEIQSYKGLGFVFITAIVLFFVLKRRDTLEEKQLKKLKENENSYYSLFNNMSHGIAYAGHDGVITSVNQAALDILGTTESEMIGSSVNSEEWKPVYEDSSGLQPEDHPGFEAIKTGKPVHNRILGALNQETNTYTWLRLNSIPEFKPGESKPFRVCIIFTDISQLKNSQDELKLSQKVLKESLKKVEMSEFLLNEASKISKIGAYEYQNDGGQWFFSDQVYKILGLPKSNPLPLKELSNIITVETNKRLIEASEKCMKQGVPFDIEFELIQEITTWVRVMTIPIYNDDKEIIGRRGVVQDITDLKLFENELKKSKEELEVNLTTVQRSEFLLREAGKLAKIGAYELNGENNKLYWSDQMFEILGYDGQKAPKLEKLMEILTDTSKERMKKGSFQLENYGTPFELELELINFKNNHLWVRIIAEPIFNEEHKVVGRRGVLQDISSLKKAQFELEISKKNIQASLDMLEKSEHSLRQAGQMAKVGYWEHDAITGRITWSDVIYDIYGIKPEETLPDMEAILTIFEEKSMEVLGKAANDCITKGIPYDLELQLVNLKNEKLWIRNMGKAIYNDQGEFIGRRGVLQDITEHKTNLELAQKSEDMYRLLADNTSDLICLHNPDTSFRYLSPSLSYLMGYDQIDLIDKKIDVVVHPEDLHILVDAFGDMVKNGTKVDALSYRVRHKSGNYIWFESLGNPIFKEGVVVAFATTSRDITQWMSAKKVIEDYQLSLQKLTTEISLIEENQKKQIAANIHDHLSQSLVISKMRITELEKRPGLESIHQDLEFVKNHISEALDNSRKITYELSPPVLYQLGIIDTLYWYTDEIEEKYNIKVKFHSNVSSIKLSDINAILIFRCIQEVVTNTIKYANASLVTIDFDKDKTGVSINIMDNGGGFETKKLQNPSNHTNSGFGLFAVKERIQNMNGKFSIVSEINVGTTVNFFVPLS